MGFENKKMAAVGRKRTRSSHPVVIGKEGAELVDAPMPTMTFACHVCGGRKSKHSQLARCQVAEPGNRCKTPICKKCVKRWGFRSRAACCGQEMGPSYWDGVGCRGCKKLFVFGEFGVVTRRDASMVGPTVHQLVVQCPSCEAEFCYDCGSNALYGHCFVRQIRSFFDKNFHALWVVRNSMPNASMPPARKLACLWRMAQVARGTYGTVMFGKMFREEFSTKVVKSAGGPNQGKLLVFMTRYLASPVENVLMHAQFIDLLFALLASLARSYGLTTRMHASELTERELRDDPEFVAQMPSMHGRSRMASRLDEALIALNGIVVQTTESRAAPWHYLFREESAPPQASV